MVQGLLPSGDLPSRARPKALAAIAAISSVAIAVGLTVSIIARPVGSHGGAPAPTTSVAPVQGSIGSDEVALRSSEPATPRPPQHASPATGPGESAQSEPGSESHALFAEQAPERPVDAPLLPEPVLPSQMVPLPVPRPPELRGTSASESPRRAARQASRRTNTTSLAAPKEDERSFFEKLFGIERSQGPALAYAALEGPTVETAPRRRLSPLPFPEAGGATAVYDISARIVTLPNGEKLEAHSGLGDSMDDPRYVDQRMRGATPPGTYDLTAREQPFHGVRALRLTPVGGSAAVYNRTGLLAHTYLLGPNGASNGCVSFKDYERFLQAYLRGEFQRLVVVPGLGQDVLPVIAAKAAPAPGRLARRSGDMKVATLP